MVYQHGWLGLSILHTHGALFFFDFEWNHFIFNALAAAALIATFFGTGMHRAASPARKKPLVFWGFLLGGILLQGYHTIEHMVRLYQHLTLGCEPCLGILGSSVNFVYLHFAFNTVVLASSLAAFQAFGFLGALRRMAAGDTSRSPSSRGDAKILGYSLLFLAVLAFIIFSGGAFLSGGVISQKNTPTSSAAVCTAQTPRFQAQPSPLPSNTVVDGLAWGDYDGDGWDDLFVSAVPGDNTAPSRLLHNDAGSLRDATAQAGLPLDLRATSGFFADYDNDGRLDLFVVEAIWSDPAHVVQTSRIRAFRNAEKTFVEVTDILGLDRLSVASRGGSLAFADLDQDGRLDIIAAFNGRNRRYPEVALEGNHFWRDASLSSGWIQSVCGREPLDDFFGEEPRLAKDIEDTFGRGEFQNQRGCIFIFARPPVGRVLPFFSLLNEARSISAQIPGELHIFKNTGSGFTDIGPLLDDDPRRMIANQQTAPGLRPWPFLSRKFFQPAAIDINHDRKIDVLVATDVGANLLLINDGGFKFHDASDAYGLNKFASGMGIAIGDPQRNGELEIVITNVSTADHFRQKTGTLALIPHSLNRLGFGWGTSFIDADSDGWTDLIFTNGNVPYTTKELTPLGPSSGSKNVFSMITPSFDPNEYRVDRFYHNQQGELVEQPQRETCLDTTNTRALAVSDIDRDGYEDLAVGTVDLSQKRGVTIYKNNGGPNHYLKVNLRGRRSNSFGIGAIITVIAADNSRQSQLVAIGQSFAAQHSLTKTFGLASQQAPVTVNVNWPSGTLQRLSGVEVDATLTITEPEA